jgi:phosphate transport system protein
LIGKPGGDDLVSRHTLSVFDDELEQLRALVCEMGGRVEAAVVEAVGALLQRDETRARAVLDNDARIDALAARIEKEAVHLIALRSPLADDLRDVLAAFKIAGLIARMGDCAVNIAVRATTIGDCREITQMKSIANMRDSVLAMVKNALDAFTMRNSVAADRVAGMDDAVDHLHAAIFRALVDRMADDPRTIPAAAHLLFVSQKLERIGDHAVGIADMVRFAAVGRAGRMVTWDAAPDKAA